MHFLSARKAILYGFPRFIARILYLAELALESFNLSRQVLYGGVNVTACFLYKIGRLVAQLFGGGFPGLVLGLSASANDVLHRIRLILDAGEEGLESDFGFRPFVFYGLFDLLGSLLCDVRFRS